MRLFRLSFLLAVFVFSSNIFAQNVRVTILHVNDVYQFAPVDGGTRGGLARLLTLKKQALAENPNTIFTLGGDTVSPSVETRTYKGAQMIDAWNAVGIDYAVFGNHEFDIKTPELLQRMKESKFTWLGANVFDTKTNKIFADTPPFVVKEIGGIKIGIVGLLLPETKETSSMEASLQVKNYCETAKEIVPKMRAAGVNFVLGLTHLSMAQDKELAKCADFNLILGGHEHTLLQSSANGTPIFKMTADARELGKFNLNFDAKTKRFESMDWEIIPVTDKIADAPEFASVFEKYKDLLQKLAEPVGRTGEILDALSISNRTKETNIGNFVADAYRNAAKADVALVNGGSIRADLTYNVGTLTKRDVLSILPFNNPIVKIEISGKTLREVLEHGVARSAVGEDGEPGRFPQISGMSFKYDTTKPARSRVTEISIGGKLLDEKKNYTLATSDFLVSRGGDGYTMLKDGKVLINADAAQKDSDVFEAAIKSAPDSTIAPKLEGRIVRLK
ncbi:MAG TPA: bifunctional UDP-sugar hydrolase/5'-nucleotidase, partial [Pyrinomonadaceae bacterium]|nr:bifunctional UDP-sugar hydrolase/5'-nucleotidase [Pyrinomonadaceae bacterium]